MRANVWSGRNTVQVENVPDPKILNDRDAIVKITSTAICGSDLHLYDGYIPTMEKGDILGHEFMGEVVETGRGVANLEVGDRVVVPFPIACGNCWSCQHELYSLCENSNPNAGMAEKMFGHPTAGHLRLLAHHRRLRRRPGRVRARAVRRRRPAQDRGRPHRRAGAVPVRHLPDRATWAPTSATSRAARSIAVFGAGPVGQFAIASAVMLGAERVIAIDQYDYRLQMALNKAGATDAINFDEDPDVVEQLKELTGGRGPGRRDRRRRHGGRRTATACCTPSTGSSRRRASETDRGARAARRDPGLPAGRHRLGDRRLRRPARQVPRRARS